MISTQTHCRQHPYPYTPPVFHNANDPARPVIYMVIYGYVTRDLREFNLFDLVNEMHLVAAAQVHGVP